MSAFSDFKIIDLSTWARAGHYKHFSENPCTISLCDDINITSLYNRTSHSTGSFYTAVLYCVTRIINSHTEFRMTEIDAPEYDSPRPAIWDFVNPVHNVFHRETETYTSVFTVWDENYGEFARRAADDIKRASRLNTFAVPAPDNVFEASCMPWRHFTSVSAETSCPSLSPLVVWGRVRESGGTITMPLSISVNHAAADGYHLVRFINEAEDMMNDLNWLP